MVLLVFTDPPLCFITTALWLSWIPVKISTLNCHPIGRFHSFTWHGMARPVVCTVDNLIVVSTWIFLMSHWKIWKLYSPSSFCLCEHCTVHIHFDCSRTKLITSEDKNLRLVWTTTMMKMGRICVDSWLIEHVAMSHIYWKTMSATMLPCSNVAYFNFVTTSYVAKQIVATLQCRNPFLVTFFCPLGN